MLATEADLAIGFFGIIKQFGWKKVAFIEQDENLFTVVSCILYSTDSTTNHAVLTGLLSDKVLMHSRDLLAGNAFPNKIVLFLKTLESV